MSTSQRDDRTKDNRDRDYENIDDDDESKKATIELISSSESVSD